MNTPLRVSTRQIRRAFGPEAVEALGACVQNIHLLTQQVEALARAVDEVSARVVELEVKRRRWPWSR